MYPHVTQFETRRRELDGEWQLLRERAENRSAPARRGGPIARAARLLLGGRTPSPQADTR